MNTACIQSKREKESYLNRKHQRLTSNILLYRRNNLTTPQAQAPAITVVWIAIAQTVSEEAEKESNVTRMTQEDGRFLTRNHNPKDNSRTRRQ